MGIELNRAGLAEHMGVSLPTIDTWRKEGMPVKQRGGPGVPWVFDLAEVIRWWGTRQVDAATDDTPTDLAMIEKRTAMAKMQQAELAAAKARKEVAPIRDFERGLSAIMAEVRTNVMNTPQRVVIQLLGETDEARFKQVLRAELVLALQAAATGDLVLSDDEDDEDGK